VTPASRSGRATAIDVNVAGVESALRAVMPRESDIPRILRDMQTAALHFWKTTAQKELRSTSRDYVAALGPGKATDDSVSIVLQSDNKIVDMLENGFKGGDMRTWMFSSKKTRTTKDGHKLLVIPFRHGAPGGSGRNTGPVMPPPIANAAAKLLATLSKPAKIDVDSGMKQPGGTAWIGGPRGRLGFKSRGIKGNAEASTMLATKSKEWHKSSIYLGMIRKGQPTKAGIQTSGFSTFRTISSKPGTDSRSWFHPGIRARKLAEKTQDYVTKIAGKIVMQAIAARDKKANA
jgi:hypothetical protein